MHGSPGEGREEEGGIEGIGERDGLIVCARNWERIQRVSVCVPLF